MPTAVVGKWEDSESVGSNHPNKIHFKGVLTRVDEISDKPPSGARGHKVLLTRSAAVDALSTLIGMGINAASTGKMHFPAGKNGVIERAEISGNDLLVYGYMFKLDCAQVIRTIRANAEEWGMSYEMHDAHVRDMRADVYVIDSVVFTGAAVVLRENAAYKTTSFVLLGDES